MSIASVPSKGAYPAWVLSTETLWVDDKHRIVLQRGGTKWRLVLEKSYEDSTGATGWFNVSIYPGGTVMAKAIVELAGAEV